MGIDHVKVMEGMGGLARRVTEPQDIRAALAWAVQESNAKQLPALVEILIEREANAAMGTAINAIKEWEAADNEVQAPAASYQTVTK
jgi:tartronate-semialdehyde synthase